MAELMPLLTPMSTAIALDPDENGEAMDQREYKSMIGSLQYITAIRSEFSSPWGCVHFQAFPCSSHKKPSDPFLGLIVMSH
jgi:hypothetical protein